MACSSLSRSFGRRQPRARALVPAFAVLLLVVCYAPLLKADQGAESTSPVARIARNRALIANADKLKLSPIQIGGLWELIASDYQDLGQLADSETAYNRALA